jgi:hypothetical protein
VHAPRGRLRGSGRAAVSGGPDASYPVQRSRSAISSRLPAGSLK